jgi:cytochrome b subunit of formate dehydrogenase
MKKSPVELINLSFSAIMVLLTVTGFFVFLFTDLMSDRVFGIKRYVLAFLFIAYAVYRIYRIYGALKPKVEKEI